MFEDHMYEGNNSEEMCNNKSYSSLDSRRGQAVLKETDDDIVWYRTADETKLFSNWYSPLPGNIKRFWR